MNSKASGSVVASASGLIDSKSSLGKLPGRLLIIAALALAGAAWPASAQEKRISPHETIYNRNAIQANPIMIVYGRPYTKDPKTGEPRKIWGGLLEYGAVWRTGADEATLLVTQKPIMIGETEVPAGAHTLFTYLDKDGAAKLIVSKKTGQWGVPYNEKMEAANELGRIDMKKEALDKTVDQFTIVIEKNPSGGGLIKLMWENTQYSVAFTAKN